MSTAPESRRLRAADLLALGLLAVSVTIGLAAFRAVPDQVQVHWSGGFEDAYWGIRTLPKAVGLFVVPGVAAGLFVLLRGLPLVSGVDELAGNRWVYDAVLVLLVATMCGAQLLLVVLNVV